MIRYRVEETINRPVHEVFPYFGDPRLHPEWMDVSDVEVMTAGELRVGTKVQELMKLRERKVPFSWEITRYEPGARMAFRTIDGPMNWDGGFEIAPLGVGASHIVSTGEVRLKGWQRILEPFVGGEVRRGETSELARLKQLLERPA